MLTSIPSLAPWLGERPVEADENFVWSQLLMADNKATNMRTGVAMGQAGGFTTANGRVRSTAANSQMLGDVALVVDNKEDCSLEVGFRYDTAPATTATDFLYNSNNGTASNGGLAIYINYDTTSKNYMLRIQWASNGTWFPLGLAADFINRDWHFAVCRSEGTWRVYINGVLKRSRAGNPDGTFSAYGALTTYNRADAGFSMVTPNSYRWGARVLKGKAAYNAEFVPPTSLPDVEPDYLKPTDNVVFQTITAIDPRFNDLTNKRLLAMHASISANYGRMYIPDTTGVYWSENCEYFGAGDFTVECYANLSHGSISRSVLMGQWVASGVQQGWLLSASYTGSRIKFQFDIRVQAQDGTIYQRTLATTTAVEQSVAPMTDFHLAVVRQGITLKLYLNGVAVQESVAPENGYPMVNTGVARVSNSIDSTWSATTRISNMRIAKKALYTKNFTVKSALPRVQR